MRPVNLRNTSTLRLAAPPGETIGAAMDGPARGTTGLAMLAAAVVLVTAPAGLSAEPRRDRGEDVRAREAWFYGQRAFPRAKIARGAYLRARRRGASLPHFPGPRPDRPAGKGRPRAASASFAWSPIGPRAIDTPGPHDDAGRVTSLAIQSNQIVYAGSAGGGVWKTTDRGVHWSPVFDGQPTMAIGAVAIDPNNASTVYAGTGEANFSRGDSYYGAGLYKSPNAGASWFRIDGALFDDCTVAAIVVKPGDPKTIGVAVAGAGVGGVSGCGLTRTGVYVTTDGGLTWSLRLPRPGGIFAPAEATDLAISPTDPALWFAGMRNGSVWRSTDSGQSWGPVMIDTKTGAAPARTALSISPSNPKFIVAAVDNLSSASETVDVFVSGDGGVNWGTPLPVASGATLCGAPPQCWYDLDVAFDPSTPRRFYLGTVRLFRYLRPPGSGWSFTQRASANHSDYHALAHDPLGALWTGTDGGVATTSAAGHFVMSHSGDLSITEFEPGISGDLAQILGGTQDNGTLLFTGAQRWKKVLGGDGGFAASDVTARATLVASNQTTFVPPNPRVFISRSTDSGATWTPITPALPIVDTPLFYSPLMSEPGAPTTLYAGSQSLWRSTDRGTSWSAVGSQFPNAISAIGTGTTTATATNTTAYVGFVTGGVRVSTNVNASSPTWAAAGPGPPNLTVTDIWVNPSNPQEAYAALGGFSTTAHLFHTGNGGATWEPTADGLPNTPINAVTVDTSGAFPVIYVGTDVGVFASGDGGGSWANASTNLPATVVMDLLLDPGNDVLIAATHGRGAFTARLSQAPPFASITTPTAITGPVEVRFNVPVKNVTTANVVLRVQGTTPNLHATVTCEDAGAAPVSCSGGPVSRARLQPSSALIPGERYQVFVNLSGAPKVTDGLGNDVLFASRAFRASLTETFSSAAADYTWRVVKPTGTPGPLGGTYAQHHLAKASASFAFKGPQVTWITVSGPDQGMANVYIDGTPVATALDHYAPTRTYNVRETFSGLSAGNHVLRIEPTGTKSAAATDAFVAVDGMQVGDTTADPTPPVTYRWQPDSAFDSMLGYVRSDLGAVGTTAAATTATFTFRGPAVVWHTVTGPSMGWARVTVDGVNQGVVDNYDPVGGVIDRTFGGFADAVHTMVITVLGTKQAASSGTFVAIKGWDVK
jgi:hypothetical protein